MANSYIVLGDALYEEKAHVSHSARCSGKVLALCSLVIGLGCALLLSSGADQSLAVQKPIDTMALAMPSTMGRVRAAENTLRRFGIPPSPFETLALAAIDATNRGTGMRDVAMMASKMDPNTQAQLSGMASAVDVKAEQLAGITAPTGFFDPVGFSTEVEGVSLMFLREAELKHGRVGMIATLGMIVGEKFHPIYSSVDAPAGTILGPSPTTEMGIFYAPGAQDLPGLYKGTELDSFWPALFLLCGGIEALQGVSGSSPYKPFSGYELKEGWSPTSGASPGDYGFDPLGLKPKDPKGLLEMQNKEINNGRLAMLAAAGIVAQELVTGQKIFG